VLVAMMSCSSLTLFLLFLDLHHNQDRSQSHLICKL
jgi:hypothetical protein